MTHDLLLAKIATPKEHALRQTITRHKTRLHAELRKAQIRRGFASLQDLRNHIDGVGASRHNGNEHIDGQGDGGSGHYEQLRWVRINTLKTTSQCQIDSTFKKYTQVSSIEEVHAARDVFHIDDHIPNLIALPRHIDLSKSPAYASGETILQDKASCFPAYLLDPKHTNGDIVDACAAPGNKTTHLAALLVDSCKKNPASDRHTYRRRIFAFERDKQRAETLKKMTALSGTDESLRSCGGSLSVHYQDFLNVDPQSQEMQDVGALLLDPSCSGSGIVGRDDAPAVLELPSITPTLQPSSKSVRKRKRKRSSTQEDANDEIAVARPIEHDEEESNDADGDREGQEKLKERLRNLSTFQTKLIRHAMAFPKARKIVYSTCSIHEEENEQVVLRALSSDIARERRWRILTRDRQPDGLRKWPIRGKLEADDADATSVREACIRCEKGTKEGTMGFFVCGFVRDDDENEPSPINAETGKDEDSDHRMGFEDGREDMKVSREVGRAMKRKRNRKGREKDVEENAGLSSTLNLSWAKQDLQGGEDDEWEGFSD